MKLLIFPLLVLSLNAFSSETTVLSKFSGVPSDSTFRYCSVTVQVTSELDRHFRVEFRQKDSPEYGDIDQLIYSRPFVRTGEHGLQESAEVKIRGNRFESKYEYRFDSKNKGKDDYVLTIDGTLIDMESFTLKGKSADTAPIRMIQQQCPTNTPEAYQECRKKVNSLTLKAMLGIPDTHKTSVDLKCHYLR